MKNTPNLQDLLDRYWEGETTLEEERWLKSFFASDAVPEQYRREAQLFRAMSAEQAVTMPATPSVHLPQRRFGWYSIAATLALLLTAGMWWWSQPAATVQPPIARQEAQPAEQPTLEAPASPVAALPETSPESVVTGRRQPGAKPKMRRTPKPEIRPEVSPETDTYEDPEQALAEIRAILSLVSSKINKGKNTLEKGLREVDNVDILVKKSRETNG